MQEAKRDAGHLTDDSQPFPGVFDRRGDHFTGPHWFRWLGTTEALQRVAAYRACPDGHPRNANAFEHASVSHSLSGEFDLANAA